MNRLWVIVWISLFPFILVSQNEGTLAYLPDSLKRVVLMSPTGNLVQDLPEMRLIADTTVSSLTVMDHIENSFIDEFLDVYFLAQIYLRNKKNHVQIEPAYLALTENQGGFAKFGFALQGNGSHEIKEFTPYVDVTEGQATARPDRLMSITQLYPHEMGHVLYHMLSPEDSLENNTRNVDMHFFSIVTDYSTAFNEGFAEHIENISRIYEKNEKIRQGIHSDTSQIRISSEQSIKGFKKDFRYPYRMGFYKASMLNWYQKYEDYKRYEHSIKGDVRYQNAVLTLANTEDQLTYRNAGVALNRGVLRNYVQLMATEGTISAFFTKLSTSDLANHYLKPEFYNMFMYDSTLVGTSPQELFGPMQNQFMKYMHVLHHHVVFNNSSKAQLIDFIEGYMNEFSSEAPQVRKIFRETLGIDYTNQLPPPLWVLVKDYPHRLLVFDPFDAITVPFYTFDLNAAETEDLLTIEGISRQDAEAIVSYRNSNGFFTNFQDLKNLPGLSPEDAQLIISSALDEDYFDETLKDFEPRLSIGSLIVSPLKYIMSRAVIYFLLLFGIFYFVFYRKKSSAAHTALLFTKYFLLWTSLVLAGLISVFLVGTNAFWYLLIYTGLLALFSMLVYRKRPGKNKRTLAFLGIMFLLVSISIL